MGRLPTSLLIDTHPDLCLEVVDPSVLQGLGTYSNKRIEWKCGLGHTWKTGVYNRTMYSTGCPYCKNVSVLPGFNDIATLRPDIVPLLADIDDAYKYTPNSSKKIMWRCEKGHEWKAVISNVISKNERCPYCNGKRVCVGENDLQTMYPDVTKELVDFTLGSVLSYASNKVVEWKCSVCGNVWSASVANRTIRHSGCPYCSGLKRTIGVNDLRALYPNVADMLVDQSLAVELGPSSDKKVLWHCSVCDSVWSASVSTQVNAGGKCPYCTNRRHRYGFNDFATLYPDLTKELVHPELAINLAPHSEKLVEWICPNGHRYETRVRNRVPPNSAGCPLCANIASSSKAQNELVSYLRILLPNEEIIVSDRKIIAPLELDVVIPSRKIAIEFNGVIWHCERWHSNYRTQHYDKTVASNKAGYQLIHVWSDDWRLRKDVVLMMLAYKLHAVDHLGKVLKNFNPKICDHVGARSLVPNVVSGSVAKLFLDAYHIQGGVTATYHFGLFDEDGDLRAVFSVRHSKSSGRLKRKDGEWEIQRYAALGSVVGGFSKLMHYAETYINDQNHGSLTKWISFSANDVSNGDMYLKSGFVMDKLLKPDYKYVDSKDQWKRKAKECYQKKRFINDPDLVYEDGWTEHDAALANNLYRIYDCGKKRWIKYV